MMSVVERSRDRRRLQLSATSRLIVDALSLLREADPAPVYLQIERGVRLLVADGRLAAGDRLPAVRALAHELGITSNTVARAYTELVDQGIVVARSGGGSIIASHQPAVPGDLDRMGHERLRRVARHLVAYSLALGHTPAEVIHAVRAELVALGRVEANRTQPRVEVLSSLPTQGVPSAAHTCLDDDQLDVHGLVERHIVLRRQDLEHLPRAECQEPFACDEGWVVPSLDWSGVWLSDVLSLASPLPAARFVRVGAGTYTLPLSLAEAGEALLADHLDGQPLVLEHGAPWRLIVPGGACYTSVKWVKSLELVADPGARRVQVSTA